MSVCVHAVKKITFHEVLYFLLLLFRALVRPGRFDNQIHIHMPDARARHNILKVHAKKVKLAPG